MAKPSEKEILKERAIGKLLSLGLTEAELRALEIIK
jgi:hypothetical protein